MDVQPFYAFLDGIKRKIKHATSETTGLTNRKIIEKYEYEEGGLCQFVMITVNNADVKVKLRFDEDHWEWSPNDLQNYGMTEPNPYGVWLGQYDNANDNYTVMFVPQNMLSFSADLILETFYTTAAYNVVQYECIVYEIISKNDFITSLQKFSTPTTKQIKQERPDRRRTKYG